MQRQFAVAPGGEQVAQAWAVILAIRPEKLELREMEYEAVEVIAPMQDSCLQ